MYTRGTRFSKRAVASFRENTEGEYVLKKDAHLLDLDDVLVLGKPRTGGGFNELLCSILPDAAGFVNGGMCTFCEPSEWLERARPTETWSETWFDKRMEKCDQIAASLKGFSLPKWVECLSSTNPVKLPVEMGSLDLIGFGTFGQVFSTTIDGNEIVIKEAILDDDTMEAMKPTASPSQYSKEAKMLELTSQLLHEKKCPSFLDFFLFTACTGCNVRTLLNKRVTGSCSTTFIEFADGNLKDISMTRSTLQISFLYQMLIALHYIQTEYGMVHRDLKLVNILYTATPELKGKYFEYKINGKTYYVPNAGYVFYIADFGIARMFKPSFALTDDLGERNGKVSRLADGSLILNPLPKETFVFVETPRLYLNWKNGQRTLRNRGPYLHSKVDLNDVLKFPPWNFNGDIQDVLKMIVGGKHSVQKMTHKKLTQSKVLTKRIEKYVTDGNYGSITWGEDMAYQLIAQEMLDKLYTPPSENVKVSDVFGD